ncbi:MAG TPA: hypothetical protein PLP33_14485 [Leptospiraceae bacterium]|nr:hypothetical protein [Leptospiraceae bacterium]
MPKLIISNDFWEGTERVISIRPETDKPWESKPVGGTLTQENARIVHSWLSTALPEIQKISVASSEKIKNYENWLEGTIFQLADPAFLITFQSGSQLINEIVKSARKLLTENKS